MQILGDVIPRSLSVVLYCSVPAGCELSRSAPAISRARWPARSLCLPVRCARRVSGMSGLSHSCIRSLLPRRPAGWRLHLGRPRRCVPRRPLLLAGRPIGRLSLR